MHIQQHYTILYILKRNKQKSMIFSILIHVLKSIYIVPMVLRIIEKVLLYVHLLIKYNNKF